MSNIIKSAAKSATNAKTPSESSLVIHVLQQISRIIVIKIIYTICIKTPKKYIKMIY